MWKTINPPTSLNWKINPSFKAKFKIIWRWLAIKICVFNFYAWKYNVGKEVVGMWNELEIDFLFFLFGTLLECKSPTLPNMKGCFKFFVLCQIWLNILMDECHLRNITKLKRNHCFRPLHTWEKKSWKTLVLGR